MKSVVVAIDFSAITKNVIEEVKEYATAVKCKVHIVHTEEPPLNISTTSSGHYFFQTSIPPEDLYSEENEKIQQKEKEINKTRLNEIKDYMEQHGIETTAVLLSGNIAETILEEAAKVKADRIYMGANDHGIIYQLFFGSTRESIILNAKCPVVIIPPLN